MSLLRHRPASLLNDKRLRYIAEGISLGEAMLWYEVRTGNEPSAADELRLDRLKRAVQLINRALQVPF